MNPAIFIPLVIVLGPIAIVLIFLRYRYAQTQARYHTLLQLADKGIELTPQMLAEPHLEYSERRRALVLIGAGIGLMVMFAALPGHFDNGVGVRSLWGLGLLPLMIGLGYLASWWLNRLGGVRG
ncbi:MAG TPA: DUF6249 domain-containing protein [Rhodanobacteraceae bacterium]